MTLRQASTFSIRSTFFGNIRSASAVSFNSPARDYPHLNECFNSLLLSSGRIREDFWAPCCGSETYFGNAESSDTFTSAENVPMNENDGDIRGQWFGHGGDGNIQAGSSELLDENPMNHERRKRTIGVKSYKCSVCLEPFTRKFDSLCTKASLLYVYVCVFVGYSG